MAEADFAAYFHIATVNQQQKRVETRSGLYRFGENAARLSEHIQACRLDTASQNGSKWRDDDSLSSQRGKL
jgi:transposase